jgi:hypothetical protein
MTSFKMLGAGAFALLCGASIAIAQAPQTVRVRATIESIDGAMLTAKSRDGAEMKIKLADNASATEVVKASLADIKPNSYIAVTGMPQPDGSQKAVAIAIFPEALRGRGEGHHPWDYEPNSTMTNATVAQETAGVDGQTLTLKYKDGEQKVMVSPTATIVTFASKSIADLKPGQKIVVFAAKKLPDGTLEASNVQFGDYGVWR